MKLPKLLIFCVLILMITAASALADSARVLTPGGPVNMRKKANAKSSIVEAVPNRSLVEVVETAGEWSHIRYKGKTGYVKTEFLLLPASLAGKTVYPDADTLLRAAPEADAALLLPVGGWDALTVDSVADGWAAVTCGDVSGYVPAEDLSYQLETPSGDMTWIKEPGLLAETGDEVAVTVIDGASCLVIDGGSCRWAPVSDVVLQGPADETANMEAVSLAQAALKKTYKAFDAQKLYATVAAQGDAWRVGWFTAQDQYVYGALVQGEQVIFTARYTDFAAPVKVPSLLPAGQIDLRLSADTLAAGQVLDIAVSAWTREKCAYSLTLDGAIIAESKDDGHFAAAYRPRKAGNYTLTVTVTDETGKTANVSADFTVTEGGPEALALPYSQKDGWWLDQRYRTSTLDHSGCAIFTLSHALQRMGKTGDDLQPAALAKTFALCLTPDGTNNERLIREAAAVYGFSTRSALVEDARQIRTLLQGGALFSFSIARGHIALIDGLSEDGSMVHVVDSAPGATFTRIVGDSLYRRMNSGSFRAVLSLDDAPGARWYFETDEYGGLEYWLRVEYAAKRGVRLIQP